MSNFHIFSFFLELIDLQISVPQQTYLSCVLYGNVSNALCYTHSVVWFVKNPCTHFSSKINKLNLSVTFLLEYEALAMFIFVTHKNANVFKMLINN